MNIFCFLQRQPNTIESDPLPNFCDYNRVLTTEEKQQLHKDLAVLAHAAHHSPFGLVAIRGVAAEQPNPIPANEQ